MGKGIKRKLKKATIKVQDRIRAISLDGGLYARGLASEGYLGGYRDALNDVMLVLNGVTPFRDWDGVSFWEEGNDD